MVEPVGRAKKTGPDATLRGRKARPWHWSEFAYGAQAPPRSMTRVIIVARFSLEAIVAAALWLHSGHLTLLEGAQPAEGWQAVG